MGFIPEDAKWYLADIVEEHIVEDDPDRVVYINIVLVRADSPEEAYARALELGHQGERTYVNTDDKRVLVKFRGLRDLNVIHDELEHGAELIYEEEIGITEEQVKALVSTKSDLGVFRPIVPSSGPNLMPRDIAQMLDDYMSASDEQ